MCLETAVVTTSSFLHTPSAYQAMDRLMAMDGFYIERNLAACLERKGDEGQGQSHTALQVSDTHLFRAIAQHSHSEMNYVDSGID
ncbi:hypothetical protein OCU04_004374 [Sclerotinia nivalis]|uniref:Uncharacterized protein n=1 Tax=Sclerotinia nivalis TaxID=352851 RepID=A0A9X0AQA8_9HELO|nr:hypothetical protein OCU04_004374 [Sclerotinia nivalis]